MKDFINTDYKFWGYASFILFFMSFLAAFSVEYGLTLKLAALSFFISVLITGFYLITLYVINLFFYTLSFFQDMIFQGTKA